MNDVDRRRRAIAEFLGAKLERWFSGTGLLLYPTKTNFLVWLEQCDEEWLRSVPPLPLSELQFNEAGVTVPDPVLLDWSEEVVPGYGVRGSDGVVRWTSYMDGSNPVGEPTGWWPLPAATACDDAEE